MLLISLLFVAAASALELDRTLGASMGGSWFNPGFIASVSPGLEAPLWNREGDLLFSDTFLRGEAAVDLTPSYIRGGPRLVFSPIAVLELRAEALFSGYFGTFTSLVGFEEPGAVYSPEVLKAGPKGAGLASRFGCTATLKARAGPVVTSAWGTAHRWDLRPVAAIEGNWIFEPEDSLLLARQDLALLGAGVLLWEEMTPRDLPLRMGGIIEARAARISGDHFVRTGALVTWEFRERWTLLATAEVYLEHRVRAELFPPFIGVMVSLSP